MSGSVGGFASFPVEPLDDRQAPAGCGSVLLLPEWSTKPLGDASGGRVASLFEQSLDGRGAEQVDSDSTIADEHVQRSW